MISQKPVGALAGLGDDGFSSTFMVIAMHSDMTFFHLLIKHYIVYTRRANTNNSVISITKNIKLIKNL